MTLHEACYRAILRELREPDQAQDAFQEFYLCKFLNDKLPSSTRDMSPEAQMAFCVKSATNFARDWRRKLVRERNRHPALDPSRPYADPRYFPDPDLTGQTMYDAGLAELSSRAPRIVRCLERGGEGCALARKICRQARARGANEFQILLRIYEAVYPQQPSRPRHAPKPRKRGAALNVNAFRLRRRLTRLRPYLRGNMGWPDDPKI